ncbi:MAG: hypothetical protein VYE68_08060 [Acidobacteriota bacterium]|nr:hypothetical protein [Acidobacteriota bacterium]
MVPAELSYRRIATFWLPLASTWVMMAVEGPYLAAIIARLESPTENLAAFGVAFAFAIIIEAPVIMLMAASTALVKNASSYRALRRFTYGLSVALTVIQLLAVLPSVFSWVASAIGLPTDVARLAHHGLIIMLPWPIAIGYRRFRQGLLIRHNLTRRVAYGTALRLGSMTITALVAARIPGAEGVHVGTTALAVGVIVEALASRVMTRHIVTQFRIDQYRSSAEGSETPLTIPSIGWFYLPLAMTSVLAMAVQPTVTFFMGQSRFPLESLAVLPVIHGLTFVFRALGLSYQEVGIVLFGNQWQHYRRIRNFGIMLAVGAAGSLALIVFTPLSTVWFEDISGLSPELAAFAVTPARVLALLPAGSVWICFQRSVLMHARQTAPITWAGMLELGVVVAMLFITVHTLSWVGAVAATTAIIAGRLVGILFLIAPTARARRQHTIHRFGVTAPVTVGSTG